MREKSSKGQKHCVSVQVELADLNDRRVLHVADKKKIPVPILADQNELAD